MEEKGGRSGRGGQREEGGNKHPFAREQSSQIQLMASPGRGGGGKRWPKFEVFYAGRRTNDAP